MQQNVNFNQESGAGLEDDQLPAYAEMLAAFHRACSAELHQIIRDLPIRNGDHVVDLACGDGMYLPWLAERVVPDGSVRGVDLSPAYLRVAQRQLDHSDYAQVITLDRGDVYNLQYDDSSFDVVWCAHSLYSLPDPLAALREMYRVVKPQGYVIILENDTLHHYILPWPPELELAVRQAQLEHLNQSTSNSGRFYIGRNLCPVFDMVGLKDCHVTAYTINHNAPLSSDEYLFLSDYLQDLGARASNFLSPEAQIAFNILINPESETYILNQPSFFATHVEIVAWGRKEA